jgi:hypothetical protein
LHISPQKHTVKASQLPHLLVEAVVADLQFPGWQKFYYEALIEIDLEKLGQRMRVAEEAIYRRINELRKMAEGRGEEQAIQDALHFLLILKTETLN